MVEGSWTLESRAADDGDNAFMFAGGLPKISIVGRYVIFRLKPSPERRNVVRKAKGIAIGK